MSAFFFQTKTTATVSLISVGANAPVQMACLALNCNHDTCPGVPLAAMRGKKVNRLPEVQMLCLATNCTHQGCVAARQSVLLAPTTSRVVAAPKVDGVIELAGAVQMACVASNCAHASCLRAKRSSSPAPTDVCLSPSPLQGSTAHTKSKMGADLVRRNAITGRSPRLGLDAEELGETEGPMRPLSRLIAQLSPANVVLPSSLLQQNLA